MVRTRKRISEELRGQVRSAVDNDNGIPIIFKYGTRKSDGYSLCSLYLGSNTYLESDKLIRRYEGGGYDMKGSCLGSFMMCFFGDRITRLREKHYGMVWLNAGGEYKRSDEYSEETPRLYLDGSCGFESMQAVLKAIGIKLTRVTNSRNKEIYWLQKIQEER
jgi:hypothetical protein